MTNLDRGFPKQLFLTLLLLASASLAWGQTVTARLSGTVQDATGALVPGASIQVSNEGTQLVWNATTDDKGDYVVPNLPPGSYRVAASKPGFAGAARAGIDLAVDARVTVNFTLKVGDVSQSVEVQATGETVNSVSGEISRTIDSQQVDHLALNGRNYLQLVTLIPGAAVLSTDQMALTTSLSTTGQAISGNRANTSSLSVDGSYNLDAGSNGSQINNVGLDFIQEVRTQTSNFSAEYGRNSGASINVITKSGTNQFHGGAVEFLRNDAFDARSFFAAINPPFHFNDFGWHLGGPIVKSKLFFFAGEEWKKIRQFSSPALRSLPSSALLRGDFSGVTGTLNYPGTSTPIPGRNISSLMTTDGKAIAAVFSRMASLATGYRDVAAGNNTTYQLSNPFDSRNDMVRLDYTLNEHQFVYLRYMHDHYNIFDPFGSLIVSQLPTTPNNRKRPGTSWQLAHTWTISPSLINEAKFNAGWHGQRVFEQGDNWTRAPYGFQFPLLYSAPQGVYPSGIPGVNVNGYSTWLGPTFYISTTTDISASDSVTLVRNGHTVKAGVLVTRNRKDGNGRPPLTGSFTFNASGNPNTTGNALADALLGNFRTFSESQYDPLGMFRFSQVDAYVTDQWKITRSLSLEAGLRFQYMPPAYTTGNNLTNFVPSLYDPAKAATVSSKGVVTLNPGATLYDGLVRAGNGIPSDQAGRISDSGSQSVLSVPTGAPRGLYHSAAPIAPRFSFAWSPAFLGKTVVRGGFGMFYDRIDETGIVPTLTNPPFAQTIQLENANVANPSNGVASALSVLGTVKALDQNLKTPYVMNFSLSVQRELPKGLFLETSYAGNQGRHLTRSPDINTPSFALLSANAALPTAQQAATNSLRPYQGFSTINMLLSDANSNYNALQVYLTKRRGWLTTTLSYTWSKTLTDASSSSETSQDPNNRHLNYGPSSFDRRAILAASFSAAMPKLGHAQPIVRTVAGGWTLSGIVHAQSGAYYSITSATAIGTWRADYIGGPTTVASPSPTQLFNTAAFAAPPTSRYGNSGVGIVQGPALETLDFSLAKEFRLLERLNLRLQGDAFNALNHANFTSLSLATTTLGFGGATAAGPGRQLQLGAKLRF
jgi:hypothetical protein